MSKIKMGFTALFTFILLSMFAALASAQEGFTPTASNPAPNIYVGTVDNSGEYNAHRTHGNFQNNTNSCANCHSTHAGADEYLLKYTSGEYEMCLSCHNGTLGFYNVKEASGAGTFGDFQENSHESATMHNVNGTVAIGSAPGSSSTSTDTLNCSSCHNPHGSTNERLLKQTINGITYSTTPIDLELVEDERYAAFNASTGENGVKITKSTGPYVYPKLDANGNPMYDSRGPVMETKNAVAYSLFCAACHDNYKTPRTSSYVAKDGNSYHTHNATSGKYGRNCASCHYAHGTDISLLHDTAGKTVQDYVNEGWSQTVAEDYMRDVSGDSNIKKFTNMASCWSCHQSSAAIDTPLVEGGNYQGKPKK